MKTIIKFILSWAVFFSFSIKAKKTDRPFPLNKALLQQLKKRGHSLMSDRLGNYILRAEELAHRKKYNSAIDLLEYHYQKDHWAGGEKAQLSLSLGQLYGQNQNKKKALTYLKKALDLKTLSYSQHISTLYYIAQIHVGENHFNQAMKTLKLLFSVSEHPEPQFYILLAHCYYSKGQNQKALKYVEKAISLSNEPRENWLKFAVAIYLHKKKYQKAQPMLEKLTALYPFTSSHWRELAGVYLLLGKNKMAFVTLDMANKMGHLKEDSDYLNLFSLYVHQGLPYQGAQLLEKKIQKKIIDRNQKNLEFLSDAFYLAREGKEALAYLKEASHFAKEPDFFIKYGYRLLEQEKWEPAEKAFKKALQTSKVKNTLEEIKQYKKRLSREQKKEEQFSLSPQKSSERFIKPEKEMENELIKAEAKSSSSQESLLKTPDTNRIEDIYLGIGIALYQRENYESALSYFKKSIEINDSFLSGYQWIDYASQKISEKP